MKNLQNINYKMYAFTLTPQSHIYKLILQMDFTVKSDTHICLFAEADTVVAEQETVYLFRSPELIKPITVCL